LDDVSVDREQRQARLLDVSGRRARRSKKHFLVPVEDVERDTDGECVTVVVHPKGKVMESPEFDPDDGLKSDVQRAVYAYYGHSFPS
jgi:hypothetical protein